MVNVSEIDVKSLSASHCALQTPLWAAIKEEHGWSAQAFTVERGGQVTDLLVLSRPLIGPFSMAYIPFAPPGFGGDELRALATTLRGYLPAYSFVLRIDLPFGSPRDADYRPLVPCRRSIQPEATIRMDLGAGYEAVRAAYHGRARRALKRSAAASLSITEYHGEGHTFDQFYELYRHTAEREGFFPRSRPYLATLVGDGSNSGLCLLTASLDGEMVGAIIVLFSQDEALYLIGATRRLEGISPSYALQDRAIALACERGCSVYDLYGVGGPEGRDAHLASLELFKRSFGGTRIERPPTMDWPYHPLIWRLYRCAEGVRYAMLRLRRSLRRAP